MYIHSTIQYYNNNANSFIAETINADMRETYSRFETYMKKNGCLLDLGCGSGRDSLYFLQKGYKVVSVDGASSMCKATEILTGKAARCIRFDQLDYCDEFDGVWANASLLHVRKADMQSILIKIAYALKNNGVLYASYQYGENERKKGERLYSDYTEPEIKDLFSKINVLSLEEIWLSSDVRLERDEKWISIICKRS